MSTVECLVSILNKNGRHLALFEYAHIYGPRHCLHTQRPFELYGWHERLVVIAFLDQNPATYVRAW